MRRRLGIAAVAALAAVGCAPEPEAAATVDDACTGSVWAALPQEVSETSGLASSRRYPGVFWTHNDSGGDPAVFAVDSTGGLIGRVVVRGAGNRDWEDIALAPCEPGAERDCLFVGDIGDNREHHRNIAVFRFPEPDPWQDTMTRAADRYALTYPGGPRDAEALFVTDAGIHVLSKGRSQTVDLYRLPPPYRSDELRHLQRVAPPPTSMSAQITAAAADPAASRVVLRSYSGIRFFQLEEDTLRALGPHRNVIIEGQLQGEGVDFMSDGRLVLSGESSQRNPATLAAIPCEPHPPTRDTLSSSSDTLSADSIPGDTLPGDTLPVDSPARADSPRTPSVP